MSTDFSPAAGQTLRPVVPVLRQRPRPSPPARRYQQGCWRVVEAVGELDIEAVPLLRALTGGAPQHVVFDLRRVTFLDAGVLGIFVATRANQGGAHGVVRLAGPSPRVCQLITITRLRSVLPTFSSFDEVFAGHESCRPTVGEPVRAIDTDS